MRRSLSSRSLRLKWKWARKQRRQSLSKIVTNTFKFGESHCCGHWQFEPSWWADNLILISALTIFTRIVFFFQLLLLFCYHRAPVSFPFLLLTSYFLLLTSYFLLLTSYFLLLAVSAAYFFVQAHDESSIKFVVELVIELTVSDCPLLFGQVL